MWNVMTEPSPQLASTLANVKAYAAELVSIEDELNELKARTQTLTTRRTLVRSAELPRMMQELELTVIGVGNHVVELTTQIEASLPKDPDKRLKALKWLHDNGHGGALKSILEMELPSDNDALVEQATDMLESLSLHPTLRHSIHHQTYLALCREIVRSGKPAPMDDLGIFIGKIAKVET